MKLFSYQRSALKRLWQVCTDRVATELARLLLVMATGLGKTVIASRFAKRWLQEERGAILVLCHQKEILEQVEVRFKKTLPSGTTFGQFNGETKCDDLPACVFGTFGAVANHLSSPLFARDRYSLVIVDEGHRAKAETYEAVVRHFAPQVLMGMTATPERFDGQQISDLFGKPVVNLPLAKALAKGYLAEVDYRLLLDNLDETRLQELIEKIPSGEERLSLQDLNRTLFLPEREEVTVEKIVETFDAIPNCKALVFCQSIAHPRRMQDRLAGRVEGVSAVYHSGDPKLSISRREQRLRLKSFKEGTPLSGGPPVRLMLTVDKYNEGIDAPDVNLIVFLRTTSSKRIFLQQLGRGLRRLHGRMLRRLGEKKVIVLDFVGSWKRLVHLRGLTKSVNKYPPRERPTFDVNAGDLNLTELTEDVLKIVNELQDWKWSAETVLEALKPHKTEVNPLKYSHYRRYRRTHRAIPCWASLLRRRAALEAEGYRFIIVPRYGKGGVAKALLPHREQINPLTRGGYDRYQKSHRELPTWPTVETAEEQLVAAGFVFAEKRKVWTQPEVVAALLPHLEKLKPLGRRKYKALREQCAGLPFWESVEPHRAALAAAGFTFVAGNKQWTAEEAIAALTPHKEALGPLRKRGVEAYCKDHRGLPSWKTVEKLRSELSAAGFTFKDVTHEAG